MSQAIDISDAVAPVKSRRTFQFSVRALMILMTLCCVVIAMVAFPPLILFAEVFALIALAIFSLVAMVYGRGWIRPFSIICSASLLLFFLALFGMHINRPVEACVYFAIQFFGSVFVGLCGAATHGFLKKRSGIVPIPRIPFLRKWLHNPDGKV